MKLLYSLIFTIIINTATILATSDSAFDMREQLSSMCISDFILSITSQEAQDADPIMLQVTHLRQSEIISYLYSTQDLERLTKIVRYLHFIEIRNAEFYRGEVYENDAIRCLVRIINNVAQEYDPESEATTRTRLLNSLL